MSNINKPLVSIIIPIYNVADYLEQCLESAINQSYKNTEIILVDDGSIDGSGKICDNYKAKDDRVKVLHKANGGLSDARNAGLRIARGDFVTFIDGDDYISYEMISIMVESIINTKSEIAVCGYAEFYGNKGKIIDNKSNEYTTYTRVEALQGMLYQKTSTTSAWCKLYKRPIFKGIEYPYGEVCEDLNTTYRLYAKANKIVINTHIGYYYRQRIGSIINSKFNSKRMKALEFCDDIEYFIETSYPKIIDSAVNRKFAESIFILSQIPFNNKRYSKFRKKCSDVIIKTAKVVFYDRNSKISYRLYALSSILFGSYGAIMPFKIKHYIKLPRIFKV